MFGDSCPLQHGPLQPSSGHPAQPGCSRRCTYLTPGLSLLQLIWIGAAGGEITLEQTPNTPLTDSPTPLRSFFPRDKAQRLYVAHLLYLVQWAPASPSTIAQPFPPLPCPSFSSPVQLSFRPGSSQEVSLGRSTMPAPEGLLRGGCEGGGQLYRQC